MSDLMSTKRRCSVSPDSPIQHVETGEAGPTTTTTFTKQEDQKPNSPSRSEVSWDCHWSPSEEEFSLKFRDFDVAFVHFKHSVVPPESPMGSGEASRLWLHEQGILQKSYVVLSPLSEVFPEVPLSMRKVSLEECYR